MYYFSFYFSLGMFGLLRNVKIKTIKTQIKSRSDVQYMHVPNHIDIDDDTDDDIDINTPKTYSYPTVSDDDDDENAQISYMHYNQNEYADGELVTPEYMKYSTITNADQRRVDNNQTERDKELEINYNKWKNPISTWLFG